jgi:hypothetical protein
LKVNYTGCAICDSTWGNVWEEVEGERLFFCCALCVTQFRGLIERTKARTHWEHIDAVEIAGDRRGRTCRLRQGTDERRFFIAFNSLGAVRTFAELPEPDRGRPR